MKILLVEDDKNVARFIGKGLKENSFSVDIAENGEDKDCFSRHSYGRRQ